MDRKYWAGRDYSGALNVFEDEPTWSGTMWIGAVTTPLARTMLPTLKQGEAAKLIMLYHDDSVKRGPNEKETTLDTDSGR